jgi:hypothetical protein
MAGEDTQNASVRGKYQILPCDLITRCDHKRGATIMEYRTNIVEVSRREARGFDVTVYDKDVHEEFDLTADDVYVNDVHIMSDGSLELHGLNMYVHEKDRTIEISK